MKNPAVSQLAGEIYEAVRLESLKVDPFHPLKIHGEKLHEILSAALSHTPEGKT